MMKCSFCGNDVPDNVRTCPHCGIYLSRTFRKQNRDISSVENRVSPEGRKDYINPREQRPEFSPVDADPEAPRDSGSFSGPDAEPAPDSRFGPSPDPQQPPHDFSEEPEVSDRRQPPPPPNFCSLCGNSLMPGDRFCSICGAPASGGNPGNYSNPGGAPAGDPYRNRRPGNSGNFDNSGNYRNPPRRNPVNNRRRLRALNQRMESMSRMVFPAFILALGGIALAPLGAIAIILHIVIVFKSLPLVWEVISFLDSQGAEYRDWASQGRSARTMIIALLILMIAIAALFSDLIFIAVTNINVHGSIPKSQEAHLILVSVIAGFLFITNIALQSFAMIRFYDIKRMLKNLAGD